MEQKYKKSGVRSIGKYSPAFALQKSYKLFKQGDVF